MTTPILTSNHLAGQKSPYLLQHAQNPVDWYPWGDEAFLKARSEDKPVFLSIGYSTCHWCHVMARESFMDEKVADLLNGAFVAVKVDREERPDVDHVYMNVCQMLTGSGGWPLTVLLTPDKKPFFAGTYFPRDSRFGLPGRYDILDVIANSVFLPDAQVVFAEELPEPEGPTLRICQRNTCGPPVTSVDALQKALLVPPKPQRRS